jgi:hypothetical protein
VPFLGPDTDPKDRAILDASILFPGGAIASDAVPWQIDGRATLPHAEIWPLPENAFAHPRSAGTFSRFLRVYVRERQEISLRDALAKTSLIPARILESSVPQMRRKGRIANGMDADLVVFDLATIADRHVREACTHLHRYAPCHRRRRASDREQHPGLEQPARPTRATNARALNAGRTSLGLALRREPDVTQAWSTGERGVELPVAADWSREARSGALALPMDDSALVMARGCGCEAVA